MIHYFQSRRANLEITAISYNWLDYIGDETRIKVDFLAINKSHLPISISEIYLITESGRYPVDKKTHTLGIYQYLENKTVVDRVPTYNTKTPINLSALASDSGTLIFVAPQDTTVDFHSGMNFEIVTSRLAAATVKLSPKVPVSLTRHSSPQLRNKNQNRLDADNN
jgi:hypothetical protein